MKSRRLYAVAGSLLLLVVLACGGGSVGSQLNGVGPTVSSVTVSCTPSSIAPKTTAQCSAAIQGAGSYSSGVTWSVSKGTISTSGLFTAPASAGSVTVTATSTEDGTKSGTATIAVTAQPNPPTISSVAVSCNPSSIAPKATAQCSAAVQGAGSYSSAVTWSVNGGTISTSGLFTAPASTGSVIVMATSTEDGTKSGMAMIAVTAPSNPPTIFSVAVSCNPSSIGANTTSQCDATVQGTGSYSSAVTWSASEGSIDASGLFTAPASAGSVIVTAISTEDTTKSGTATVTVELKVPQSRHVVMVMEENESYSTVVGETSVWPNLNHLIDNGALPTDYYADSHPSIGNYFMLTTGQLLTTDDNSTIVWNVDNLARRMLAAGVSFKVYAEGIPQGYVGGNTGLYLIRHNPFAMLSDVADSPQAANQVIWPFTQFAVDLANGALPEFSFIIPDVDDDAHNGTPQQADAWLQTNVIAPLSSDSAFEPGGDGVLIVDFDEAATSDIAHGGGHVSPVLWGPNVKVGFRETSTAVYQHESMLRTVIELLQLANPPGAAATAPDMAEFFVQK